MRILIIGGGAAGATAAQFARKQSRDAEIKIFETTMYPQYSKCGLPYVLSGEINDFNDLVEFSEEWFQRNKIELCLGTRVTDVDSGRKSIKITGKRGEQQISYDSLVFATGASPSLPKIDGITDQGQLRKGIFQFRDMDDAKSLKDWCGKTRRNVLIIGAGLVGLEVAEALHKNGHKVTVVEFLDSILPTIIDPDMAELLVNAISETGIVLRTSANVESVSSKNGILLAKIVSKKDGTSDEIDCDTILLATGQRPKTDLAQKAGCDIGKSGHIKVNRSCETTIKGIYAVGDCTQYSDAITNFEWPVGLGTLAVKMGEVAGKNAAGGSANLPSGFINSRVTSLFNLEIAGSGPLSSALTTASIKHVQSRVKGSTLPAYYPGGKEMVAKLSVSADSHKILACQIIGQEGSGLRADIISAMIMGGLTVEDLSMLETAYAPPIAPCVDVLTTAAQTIMIKLERSKKS